jgi:phosphatidylserine/phosphatidylglycerophosphate/cardiolipin synthase-like enzyme
MTAVQLDDWFLATGERGNTSTTIDRRRGGVAWTEGNQADVLIDGTDYYACLYLALRSAGPGDSVFVCGVEGDADELLSGTGTEVADMLAALADTGADVRGLVWRSHGLVYSEEKNLMFSRAVNEGGGEVLLDNRIRRGGSHHQKMVVVQYQGRPSEDVAFVGGIDLVHGRRDDARHLGDPQTAALDADHYGDRPGWHDVQVAVRGPAVADVALTFRERWSDPAPLDTRSPWRWLMHRVSRDPEQRSPLAAERDDVPAEGPHAVQVLRTYPARRKVYPFAPEGERSIARAYIKAFGRARSLIYLEDQYLWSFAAAKVLADALRREPQLLLVIVVPRYVDPAGRIMGAASTLGRERVQDMLYAAGGDRVAIYDLEREDGTAVYVHSKACIVDDVWMSIGSDNLNRRSWTHDSELSCAIVDSTRDEREPRDPSGLGDGARKLARDTRLRLTCEHTGGALDTDAMVGAHDWFRAMRESAEALDAWHRAELDGPRPSGHLRAHQIERAHARRHGLLRWVHAHLLDPDGRPPALRRGDRF